MKKNDRMAPYKEHKYTKELNCCFDKKLPVKTSLPCETMNIGSSNFQGVRLMLIRRVPGNHAASIGHNIGSEIWLTTGQVPPLLNYPARIPEVECFTLKRDSLGEPVKPSFIPDLRGRTAIDARDLSSRLQS
jgi:hypothetical protein